MAFSFEGLHEPLLAVLQNNDAAFRSGMANVAGAMIPFDAEFIAGKLGPRGNEYATATIARVLEYLAQDPTNHIMLRFKTKDNPDVIHIDSVVLEFIGKHEDGVLLGSVLDEGFEHSFRAAFIAKKLRLNQNSVACALRRLCEDPKNYLGLIDGESNDPVPIRDYSKVNDAALVAARK